ncbi:24474_t:CDS:2 [Cetraspora pellucida]|uniref:24474_t:CDS:1 n=1 Tax=Cetraspora pellucida TaxID=1433469 RepID=A0A9N9GWI1_9GLOM|nr:24474_t:CDS:2 [Cetraspora pellucida]
MLLTGTDPSAHLFKKNIRMYNSALAFTSIDAKIDQSITETSGLYSFRIYGDDDWHPSIPINYSISTNQVLLYDKPSVSIEDNNANNTKHITAMNYYAY